MIRIAWAIIFLFLLLATPSCKTSMNENNVRSNFVLTGTISKIYLQEIPSKAKGGRSRQESRIEIQASAQDGTSIVDEFAGSIDLIQQYSLGQKVRIEATTSTGRHIKSMQLLPD